MIIINAKEVDEDDEKKKHSRRIQKYTFSLYQNHNQFFRFTFK